MERESNPAELIEALVKAGANLNATNKSWENLLWQAVRWEKPDEAIQALVKYGADVNAVDNLVVYAKSLRRPLSPATIELLRAAESKSIAKVNEQ